MSRPEPQAGVIPLSGMRGAIARGMTAGWEIPRVAHHATADVTLLQEHRRDEAAAGRKWSVTPYLLKALALTLREHPRMNALVQGNAVALQADINLGLAVSLDDGLMVPVIRQADRLSVAQLAEQARHLAEGARAGALTAGSYQRGTFTVSNLGMTAIDSFTPIINAPQVAILGVTRVRHLPVAGEDGLLGMAPMMGLHLVFDHRAVDGYPAACFLSALKQRLETLEGLR
ncbi:2-oxo acid dehydrogenase subunit E2 [Bordetella hinzii]|uniref:2-oxo acid dehydrogenase subunit E2 n=1 Tax=Bordetella hinzii TaxID=103855 RepID=UPI001150A8CF|nr:2-oxo acid dehydrogenase subunit E2 [Bordetella hinzii]QDJ31851.1 dihydrolipoyllysine acetyltransferase [Bordetella hinzii]